MRLSIAFLFVYAYTPPMREKKNEPVGLVGCLHALRDVGMTQVHIAAEIGCSQSEVSRLLNGQRDPGVVRVAVAAAIERIYQARVRP